MAPEAAYVEPPRWLRQPFSGLTAPSPLHHHPPGCREPPCLPPPCWPLPPPSTLHCTTSGARALPAHSGLTWDRALQSVLDPAPSPSPRSWVPEADTQGADAQASQTGRARAGLPCPLHTCSSAIVPVVGGGSVLCRPSPGHCQLSLLSLTPAGSSCRLTVPSQGPPLLEPPPSCPDGWSGCLAAVCHHLGPEGHSSRPCREIEQILSWSCHLSAQSPPHACLLLLWPPGLGQSSPCRASRRPRPFENCTVAPTCWGGQVRHPLFRSQPSGPRPAEMVSGWGRVG